MNIPVAVAMQVAGVSRARFNEAVASGFYRLAPTAEHRKSRRFDVPDIIGLSAFARLLHAGFPYRVAAEIACIVVDNVRNHGDDLEAVVVAWKADGERWTGPWFGLGKDNGRMCLDPHSSGWALMFQFNIPAIGKDVLQRYRQLHQSGDLAKIELGDDA